MNSEDFRSFVEDFFHAECRWNPGWATKTGLHEYDHDSPNRTDTGFRERIAEIGQLAERANKLSANTLDPSDRIDLELITGQLRAESLSLETLETWRRNPIEYLWTAGRAVDGLMKRNFAPPSHRLQALTSRLRAFPEVVDGMMSNVGNPAPEFAEVAIRLARGSVSFLGDGVESWARAAADGNPELIDEFRAVHAPAVMALENATSWLVDLLPQSTGPYAIGGDALSQMLAHEEMILTPLESLLEIATANLDRDYRDFVSTAERIDANRTPSELVRSLSDDCPTADGLLSWAGSTLDRVCGFLDAHSLVTMPTIPPPTLVETPPYYRFGAFAAMDSPGACEETAREAFYYVTPPEREWDDQHRDEHLRLFNRPVMDIITIHETYPGHYLQFANATRFPTHTRRLLSCGSNVEGWAHYVEQMMVEEGYGSPDLRIRLAQLLEALVRDCRFVVAIGLHTGTMDVDSGAALFEEKAFMEPRNALEEARRGTFDPTYLVYTLGKLQIYKLRDDWEARNGGRDLIRFHDTFLEEGGAPIRILRRRMLGSGEEDTLYPSTTYEEKTGLR